MNDSKKLDIRQSSPSDLRETASCAPSVVGIQRAPRFSPNSVDKDLAILRAVMSRFGGRIVPEDNIPAISELCNKVPEVVFSMARSEEALDILARLERQGTLVINSAEGVRNCQRSVLDTMMRSNGIPIPSSDSGEDNGYWLKRGDQTAQSHGDVVFCENREALASALEAFRSRGITDYIVQPHVKGDLVKFYGVSPMAIGNDREEDFFRTFYPSDDGQSKFGDEKINGKAHHYTFDADALRSTAARVAAITGVAVFGGDSIIKEDGSFVIIDFNDWPSFSRCRDDAANAIAALKSKRHEN